MAHAFRKFWLLAFVGFGVIAAFPAPARAAAITGQTLADARLQNDIVSHPGFGITLSRVGACNKIDGIVAKVIEPPKDRTASPAGKMLKALWREQWTVTAFGQQYPVFILFKSDGVGGTDFGISSK